MDLLANFLIGIIFLSCGIILKYFPPKKPNWVYGYRTPFSLKNPETFTFANKYSSNLMIILGLVSILTGFLLQFIFKVNENTKGLILIIHSIILSLLLIILTEKKLRQEFDRSGNKK